MTINDLLFPMIYVISFLCIVYLAEFIRVFYMIRKRFETEESVRDALPMTPNMDDDEEEESPLLSQPANDGEWDVKSALKGANDGRHEGE